MERRKTARVPKRGRCRIGDGKSPLDGLILDLSEGGMALICDRELEVASTVQVELTDQRSPILVSALVWHSRRARFQGKVQYVYGCIIESPKPEYLELFQASESSRRAPVDTSAEPSVAQTKPPVVTPEPTTAVPDPEVPEKDEEPRPFRLRLRHRTSPRTKTLTVGASSKDDARSIAEESLGGEWELLEICAA